jgi:hypothetical protein
VETVEDAKGLKFLFAQEFKKGSKRGEEYYWFDFSKVEDKDVFLSFEEHWSGAYVEIPEHPDKYAEKLNKYNEKLESYNEWAKDHVDEIAAEEAKRKRLAEKKKRDQLAAINEKIAELNDKARRLENEAPE